jgi:hypothetical protein
MSAQTEIPDILKRIAELEAAIVFEGNPLVAYENIPYTINAGDMPLFVNHVGQSTVSLQGSDEIGREFLESRVYMLDLYSAPYASGVEGEQLARLTSIFSLVYIQFAAYPRLNRLRNIVKSEITGDSGATTSMAFAGQIYFGIRFTLQVQSIVRRSLSEDD